MTRIQYLALIAGTTIAVAGVCMSVVLGDDSAVVITTILGGLALMFTSLASCGDPTGCRRHRR